MRGSAMIDVVGAQELGADDAIMVVCNECYGRIRPRVHKAKVLGQYFTGGGFGVLDSVGVFAACAIGGIKQCRRPRTFSLSDEDITWGRGWWEGEILSKALLAAYTLRPMP